MEERAPEPKRSQALAVTRSRDEDGSHQLESRQNLSTFDLSATANTVFPFCADRAAKNLEARENLHRVYRPSRLRGQPFEIARAFLPFLRGGGKVLCAFSA